MKKTIVILLALFIVTGVCYSQAPIKRKRDDKTEQTKPSANEAKRRQEVRADYTPSGEVNGHGYVDLGLPSGLKWATCNVGASTPSDYGNYYAWGETATKSNYTDGNCKTFGKSLADLTSAGIINSAGNLTMNYDAARANWGGNWRMPTKQECEELKDKCTWTWTSQDGHNGYRVTGPNGNSIFLPAASCRYDTSPYQAGERGNYWSSSRYDDGHGSALIFNSSHPSVDWYNRANGYAVRPVSE